MSHFVYILESLQNGRYYIGVTNNLQRRLAEHNNGCSKSTKPYKPYTLVYSEEHPTISSAYKREKELKKIRSRAALKKIIYKS